MRHMELIPDDLQCASVLLFMLLLLILAFLAGAYLANRGAWTGIFLHDPLTKGMKPIQFQNRVKRLLDKKPAIAATLVLLNIEHFQRINHRYGMQLGDEVLCQVYKVLCQHLDANEFMAREEGDSFFLFLLTQIRPCFKIELMKYRKIFISKLKICSRLSACGRAPVSLTAHKRMLIC